MFIAEELSFNECISLGINPKKIQIINPPFPVHDFKNVIKLDILKNEYKIKRNILFSILAGFII